MSIFNDDFLKRFGLQNRPAKPVNKNSINPSVKRSPGFDAASSSRLFWDWDWTILTFDELIRRALRKTRARSRDLEINNDYVKKFLTLMVYNIIGHEGIKYVPQVKRLDGSMDTMANGLLLDAWNEWQEEENCTVSKNFDWHQAQAMTLLTMVRDGETLIRKVVGFKNEFGFALQLIIPDSLDEQLITEGSNGNKIRLGVEYNQWRQPVNYYLRDNYEFQDYYYPEFGGLGSHEKVSADELIHVFMPYRFDQTRGFPWIHAAATRLKMIGAYEEAELVAARVGASKMGFFKREMGEDAGAAGLAQTDASGNLSMSAEPGMFEQLPPGWDFKEWTPSFPDAEFAPFMKAMLRGMGAGLNVSYTSLANDLEGVNYSSIRTGLLDERDMYKFVQHFLARKVHKKIHTDWLQCALLTSSRLKKLDPARFVNYSKPHWHGRRWEWVDPEKDMTAKIMELENGLTSKSQILAEKGGHTYEEVADQLKAEIEYAEELELPSALTPWNSVANPNAATKPQVSPEADPAEPNETSGTPQPKKPKQSQGNQPPKK